MLLGVTATTGAANAYVLTTGLSLAALVNGQGFWVKWNHTNSGAATLNLDTLGATALRRRDGATALSANDLASGTYDYVVYDSATPCFRVVTLNAGVYQPLDATLTAFAAQTTAADAIWYWTGTDAGATTSFTAAARALLDDTTAAAMCTTLGAAQLAAANVFTGRHVNSAGPTSPPAAGAHSNAFQISNTDANYGILFGSYSSTGNGWIQPQRVDGTATTYSLVLCPTGGDVLIPVAPATQATNSAGFRGLGARNLQTGAYTFVLGDAGRSVENTGAGAPDFTIPPLSSVAWPDGTVITLYAFDNMDVKRGSGVGLYWFKGDDTTPANADVQIPAGGVALLKNAAGTNDWYGSGPTI